MHVMKTALANLALISGLAAGVVGDALPPEDIPVECATICGPIIELTSKCTAKWQRLVKRDQDAIMRREWVPKLAVEPPEGSKAKGVKQREVIIFLPSPDRTTTSSSTAINLQPSTIPTRITPVTETSTSTNAIVSASTSAIASTSSSVAVSSAVQTPSTSAAAAPLPSTSTSTVTTLITFTKSSETAAASTLSLSEPETTMTSSLQIQEPQGSLYMQDNGEEDCVCLASSFDVAKVTALCSSCVAQNGFSNENIDVIVEGCSFNSLNYTMSDDSVVDNVRVDAVGPSSSSTSHAAQLAARNGAAVWGFILVVAVMA